LYAALNPQTNKLELKVHQALAPIVNDYINKMPEGVSF
jgi:hypothetical protein